MAIWRSALAAVRNLRQRTEGGPRRRLDLTPMLLASLPDLRSSVRLETPRAARDETLSEEARPLELATGSGISAPVTRTASTAAAVVNAALDV